jgi:hypothetical protein
LAWKAAGSSKQSNMTDHSSRSLDAAGMDIAQKLRHRMEEKKTEDAKGTNLLARRTSRMSWKKVKMKPIFADIGTKKLKRDPDFLKNAKRLILREDAKALAFAGHDRLLIPAGERRISLTTQTLKSKVENGKAKPVKKMASAKSLLSPYEEGAKITETEASAIVEADLLSAKQLQDSLDRHSRFNDGQEIEKFSTQLNSDLMLLVPPKEEYVSAEKRRGAKTRKRCVATSHHRNMQDHKKVAGNLQHHSWTNQKFKEKNKHGKLVTRLFRRNSSLPKFRARGKRGRRKDKAKPSGSSHWFSRWRGNSR